MKAEIIEAIKGVLELPDAERQYLVLAKAYEEAGMKEEMEAIIFLAGRRFSKDDLHSDSNEGQRKND